VGETLPGRHAGAKLYIALPHEKPYSLSVSLQSDIPISYGWDGWTINHGWIFSLAMVEQLIAVMTQRHHRSVTKSSIIVVSQLAEEKSSGVREGARVVFFGFH
jgi:hypothetical protein